MVLVVGATGLLGSEICHKLAIKGFPIRALIRRTSNPVRIEGLRKYGTVLVEGDLRDPLSLASACEGSHAVICTATAMNSYLPGENDLQTVDLLGVTSLIQAAKRAGVSHFIYISISPNPRFDFPLQSIKRSVEQHLIAAGMTYTILRPGYFMETWLPQISLSNDMDSRFEIYGKGDRPISWISVKDVAWLAVMALQKPAAWNAILETGGPEALSPLQVIDLLEKGSCRGIKIEWISEEELQTQYQMVTDPLQQSIIGLKLGCSQGDSSNRSDASKIFPVRFTTVADYITQLLVKSQAV